MYNNKLTLTKGFKAIILAINDKSDVQDLIYQSNLEKYAQGNTQAR